MSAAAAAARRLLPLQAVGVPGTRFAAARHPRAASAVGVAAGARRHCAVEAAAEEARGSFREYWVQDHAAPTIENMMLDSDAGTMDRLERPEILSALPSLTGKRVLELGAGIGRFSGTLASKAGSVVAVDFVEGSCAENRRANANCDNLEVLQADVTALAQDAGSFDLVFSNWLLMYLTDDEVRKFAKDTIKWLRPGGHLFFRESCFHSSGDHARRFNPTQYRSPEEYAQMFSDAASEDGSRFQLLATNCVESYAQLKGNVHQMWFRWEKIGSDVSERRMRLTRTNQHSPAHCHRYEKIYGRNYIYTGGDEVSQELLDLCKVPQGGNVLDIGAGLLGTALHFARSRPDIYVHAVNHTPSLASLVSGRHVKRDASVRERISLELAPECGIPEHELKYTPNSLDAIVVRETMMYLEPQDKAVLLQKLVRLLRPNGRLVIVDYTAAKPVEEMSPVFQNYLTEWGYFLMTPEEQSALVGRYLPVETRTETQKFAAYMEAGLRNIEKEFGPGADARQCMGEEEGRAKLAEARTPLIEQVLRSAPALSREAAEEAAEAAVAKIDLHLAAERASAEACARDHSFSQSAWEMERAASLGGELSWTFFVAEKPPIANKSE